LLPLFPAFPFVSGFAISPECGYGDPLDVLLIREEPAPVGSFVLRKMCGVLEGKADREGRNERNERIIAISNRRQVSEAMIPRLCIDKELIEINQSIFCFL